MKKSEYLELISQRKRDKAKRKAAAKYISVGEDDLYVISLYSNLMASARRQIFKREVL